MLASDILAVKSLVVDEKGCLEQGQVDWSQDSSGVPGVEENELTST